MDNLFIDFLNYIHSEDMKLYEFQKEYAKSILENPHIQPNMLWGRATHSGKHYTKSIISKYKNQRYNNG